MERGSNGSAAAEVWEALSRLLRERLLRKPGGHLIESRLGPLELHLRLALSGPEAGPEAFGQRLTEAVDELLDSELERAAAFRPGHAYCHRCRGSACEHSAPPTSRHVFVGYAPTGQPRFADLAQWCLSIQHPEVDRLYEDPPALVVLIHGRDFLHGAMLGAFRNPASELLGQLVAGFFPVRTSAEEGRGIVALTCQVSAWHSRGGGTRLGLNVLGRTPSGEDLERLWDREHDLPWHRAIRWAQAALQTIGTRPRQPPPAALEGRVAGILAGLARRLLRDIRARSRRTRHAALRHESGERPTRKALDDARAAAGEALFVDERTGTVVVLGERGRTHFFSPDGRLVSSVRYSREAIERKLKVELWRPATSAETSTFRQKLGAR